LFKIVVLSGKRAGTEHSLEGQDVFVLGSAPGTHLQLEDEGVYPNHVRIFKDESRLILMDVSGEGVLVNGRSQVQVELRGGDELAIGAAVLRVTPVGVPLSAALQRPASSIVTGKGAELVVLKGPDEGKTFPLETRTTIGRGMGADIALLDMKCSREHCRIETDGDGWQLVDLGSTNGTRLNDTKLAALSTLPIRHGDKVRLGNTLIEFRAAGTPVSPLDEGTHVDAEAPADRERRRAQTFKMTAPDIPVPVAALEGDLEKMGFNEVVQFLHLSHKTGELRIFGPTAELGIAFNQGNVQDAWGVSGARTPEQNFYGIARLRRGHFEFHEDVPVHESKISLGTLALLMEAMRIVDEATDPGE
jgi:pSer/pThr/pTyr-binding forkhead associated (FHA) protein